MSIENEKIKEEFAEDVARTALRKSLMFTSFAKVLSEHDKVKMLKKADVAKETNWVVEVFNNWLEMFFDKDRMENFFTENKDIIKITSLFVTLSDATKEIMEKD